MNQSEWHSVSIWPLNEHIYGVPNLSMINTYTHYDGQIGLVIGFEWQALLEVCFHSNHLDDSTDLYKI